MSCQEPREKVRKKKFFFFVIKKLFDKLPDITGLILPSLDQKNKNSNAINGTAAKRSNVKIQKKRDTEWKENIHMNYPSS